MTHYPMLWFMIKLFNFSRIIVNSLSVPTSLLGSKLRSGGDQDERSSLATW